VIEVCSVQLGVGYLMARFGVPPGLRIKDDAHSHMPSNGVELRWEAVDE
jgi:hypothetical protein